MTTETEEFISNYYNSLRDEKEKHLNENSELIRSFISFCANKKINLTIENFDYIPIIGIVAIYPNIALDLNPNIKPDKEELFEVDSIEREYYTKLFVSGYFYSEKYMIMVNPYFRREYHCNSNFSPRFIAEFWKYKSDNVKKYISIDSDRVRINVDNRFYIESDTWFGAKFRNEISSIEDGIIKLRPPLDLDHSAIEILFGNTYSVDIKWSSKVGIKVFQLEEFKFEKVRIIKNGIEYYPVRYIHAEFDCVSGKFRHFDGAIHFYTREEYFIRRDEDFNYDSKKSFKLKTLSQKLFKINGLIDKADWINLVSHYLTGDPLIFEYFEGEYPHYVTKYIERIRNTK